MSIVLLVVIFFIVLLVAIFATVYLKRRFDTTTESDTIKKSTTDIDEGTQGSTSDIPFAAPSDASDSDQESLFVDVTVEDLPEADEESSMGGISYGSGFSYPATIWSLPAASMADSQAEFTRDSYRRKDDESSELARGSYSTKGDEISVAEFEIKAPAGMLGMVVETPNGGVPMVQEIKRHSPLEGQVRVGDRLVAVDGRSVTAWNATAVARLIASKKQNPVRELIFERVKN